MLTYIGLDLMILSIYLIVRLFNYFHIIPNKFASLIDVSHNMKVELFSKVH